MTPKKLVFVIHKHDTVRPHFDFRLQAGTTLPSWAIPKGPTLDPAFKRLAMQVEDHALSYKDFEGVIEEGKYGAGPVMIWDEGTYIPEVEVSKGVRETINDFDEGQKVMKEGLEKGEIKFFLEGKKLKGSFALVKTKGFPEGAKNAWLLIKHKDEFVEEKYDANDFEKSAVSSKTIDEV